MHEGAHDFVRRTIERVEAGPVVEIGGRWINGQIRDLFNGAPYTSVDLLAGPGVDVVADAYVWRPDSPVAAVVCCEVLEHTPAPEGLISAAFEMLRPGGLLILTAATNPRAPHSGLDGMGLREGEHYANIDPIDLAEWLRPFGRAQIQCTLDGDVYAWAVKP